MADKDLIERLWESDAASALTNQAAREIEKLEATLQQVVNERNEAWCQLEEAGIEIRKPSEDDSDERIENLKAQIEATEKSPPGPEKTERLANLRLRLASARESVDTRS